MTTTLSVAMPRPCRYCGHRMGYYDHPRVPHGAKLMCCECHRQDRWLTAHETPDGAIIEASLAKYGRKRPPEQPSLFN